jgi:hypothetical protein
MPLEAPVIKAWGVEEGIRESADSRYGIEGIVADRSGHWRPIRTGAATRDCDWPFRPPDGRRARAELSLRFARRIEDARTDRRR